GGDGGAVRRATRGDRASALLVYGRHRIAIETVNSQLEKMDIERLHARTNAGFELKVHATLVALICTNTN
ncbi:MAG: hypothetical protein J7455_15110, partial [Roseiflexus sp.]|nr:hypothetical protein [Roseiflexus sp.]